VRHRCGPLLQIHRAIKTAPLKAIPRERNLNEIEEAERNINGWGRVRFYAECHLVNCEKTTARKFGLSSRKRPSKGITMMKCNERVHLRRREIRASSLVDDLKLLRRRETSVALALDVAGGPRTISRRSVSYENVSENSMYPQVPLTSIGPWEHVGHRRCSPLT
jgi:hypothetical protein